MVKVGDIAPDFSLPCNDGGEISLSALRGRKVLLWFYVEADTPGCSLEARGFRDHREYYDESNIQLLGVSFDTRERNAAFAGKLGLDFPLLSDLDHSVALAYGACSDPREHHPQRMSFLIDEEGKIERVYHQVDPRDHPARVLVELMDL